jgi:hypothetical protein
MNIQEQYHNLRTAGYSAQESNDILRVAGNVLLASDVIAIQKIAATPVNPATPANPSSFTPAQMQAYWANPSPAMAAMATNVQNSALSRGFAGLNKGPSGYAETPKAYDTLLYQSAIENPNNAQASQDFANMKKDLSNISGNTYYTSDYTHWVDQMAKANKWNALQRYQAMHPGESQAYNQRRFERTHGSGNDPYTGQAYRRDHVLGFDPTQAYYREEMNRMGLTPGQYHPGQYHRNSQTPYYV